MLASLLLILWSTALGAVEYVPSRLTPPRPVREYRAAWIATVANIDWPSTNATTTALQKAELLAIMDRAVQLKLNTLIFQVRPACDALYASSLEPWSEYLTGTMGKAPEPFYDPLAFAVEEAHKRGLELHAWFNPYRARHNAAKSPISPTHISKTHPELVRHYGKFLWLDPGEKAVQDHSLNVVIDVVKRYDIDGVHFDDYFYPYKEKDAAGRELDFPDEASWKRFGAGGKLDREEWRRENVNRFLERVYKSIKATKPWVKFGISPFGIWRPGFPAQIKGYDAYAKLYADSRKWLANGWLDYCAPQLYWGVKPPEQSFPVLLQWWTEQNPKGRHLVPGMDTTKTGGKWKPEEIVSQIRLARKQPGGSGHIHWNMKSLMRNPALDATLEREVYAEPALVPAAPWLDRSRPRKPQLTVSPASGCLKVQWGTVAGSEKASLWVLQTCHGQRWTTALLPATRTSVELSGPVPDALALTPVDRCGNAGTPAVLERNNY
ncbi:MAG TPA: family 10 glycosylhydrolase [Bacillota bacterium]|nr:family 10 glycosylhydrolase [Bacillota bacterium]